MTRGPILSFCNVSEAVRAKEWIESDEGYQILQNATNSSSRFIQLKSIKTVLAGSNLFVRFSASTGNAMGMNMLSKGTEAALSTMQIHFPKMSVVGLSGNYCTDKKLAAINWIEGRGKSVVAEARVTGKRVREIFNTSVTDLCSLSIKKNLVGSAMAGSIGGFNSHAANVVTAIFLATGQDPAQAGESSSCITLMEP
jgi:hydroxymethylglutaryl-CoA reductase (NADPH)